MNNSEKVAALKEPFDVKNIRFKIQVQPRDNVPQGEALVVAYMDARDVMERLDAVFPFNWSDSYKESSVGGVECCLTVDGVTRSDVGIGSGQEKEKSAYSDAFKRAAVKFGIGRFLYNLPKLKAQAKKFGKSYYMVFGEEDRLRNVIKKHLSTQSANQNHRPYSSEDLRSVLARKVSLLGDVPETSLSGEKNGRQWSKRQILAGEYDKILDDKSNRYGVFEYLFGKRSSRELTPAQVLAALAHLNSNRRMAENEIKSVVSKLNKEEKK